MNCQIIYADRKSVSIKIKNGDVIVRAPRNMKESEIGKILKKHEDWIKAAIKREEEIKAKEAYISDDDVKILKKSAAEYFAKKCEHYAQIMGLEYRRITITSAKGRFGSCSSQKNICFSYRLMLYPEAAREYVVVHELAHLVEMNHSRRFYCIVAKYMPDYKERRNLLKGQK